MNQKISQFLSKSKLADDSYIPVIEKDEENNYENFKIKIVDYFYNKSEIDKKLLEINNKFLALEENIENLDISISDNNMSISDIISQGLEALRNDLTIELNEKQNKNLGTSNRIIITDGSGNITTSIITTTELSCLSGISDNIQTQIDNLKENCNNIQDETAIIKSDISQVNSKIIKTIGFPNYFSKKSFTKEEVANGYTTAEGGWLKAWGGNGSGGSENNYIKLEIYKDGEWVQAYRYSEYDYGSPFFFLPLAPLTTFRVIFNTDFKECIFYSFT